MELLPLTVLRLLRLSHLLRFCAVVVVVVEKTKFKIFLMQTLVWVKGGRLG
jgi:hypothetical protein